MRCKCTNYLQSHCEDCIDYLIFFSCSGHSIARSLLELNAVNTMEYTDPISGTVRKVEIEVITQPSKSPDLNVLDLGAWHSLQIAVDKLKRELNEAGGECTRVQLMVLQKPEHRIIDLVETTWHQWESAAKLSKLFSSLSRILELVVLHRGDNNFSLRA